jgi:hypothetical protein
MLANSICVACAVALALSALALPGGRTGGIAYKGGSASLRSSESPLRVHGRAKRLFPGVSRRLKLTLVNRGESRLAVRSVRIHVGDARLNCGAANLAVHDRRLKFAVAPHSSRSVKFTLRMRAGAADACQGARFPLKFRAKASR